MITKPPTTKGGQIYQGADPHSIHGLLQQRQLEIMAMNC
jgi:hypothetical protein